VLQQLQARGALPTHPVVRVPWNDMVTIKRYLDIGAQSLLIPYVQNAEEARPQSRIRGYPPAGVRGVAGANPRDALRRVKDYAKRAHEEICVLVQVETQLRWTSSRRSPRSTASTACSSAGRPARLARLRRRDQQPQGDAGHRRPRSAGSGKRARRRES